jgi:PPOX class probable F420-dependent enzyme
VQTAELQSRFASGAVARLATVRPDGAPHVVPVVFALVDGTVYSAVDGKPKRTRQLQRLANVRADPRCALLVDHYEDDWSQLWWVRADGSGTVVEDPEPTHPGVEALAARHRQYREQRPTGPLLVITVERWSGWSTASWP